MKVSRFVLSVAAALAAVTSFAWIDTGHMVVAAIAERNLTPRAKAKIAELIPVGSDAKTNTFITASCHSDDFKNDKDRAWHYINIHFRKDGAKVTNSHSDENVVWAIRTQSDVLASTRSSKEERAQALRYLIHFVGDVHQPLHASALDSDSFPNGDRGGNDYKVGPIEGWGDRPITNLHILWDFGCGEFLPIKRPLDENSKKKIDDLAKTIVSQYPRSRFKNLGDKDPAKWADESFEIAKAFSYTTPEGKRPTPEYLARARSICRERAAIAGYRLADLLNRILG